MRPYIRPPTPPPYQEPLHDENDSRDWFWDDDGGGYSLDFGQYKGENKKLYDTSLSYLCFCRENCRRRPAFIEAFDKYYHGLEAIVETEYDRFRVPFGRKHRGKMISQCRDKAWLEWTLSQEVFTNKHPLFFVAVRKWLDNPRHYNVTRDIGELCLEPIDSLNPSDYDSDIADDIERAKESYVLPEVVEETEEDKDFIASEGSVEEEGEDEIDRLDQAATEKVAKKKRKAAGKKDQSYSKIKKSSSKALEASGRFMKTAFPCIKSPQLANPSSKVAKPPACRKEKASDMADFVEGEYSDGAESYVGSDHTSDASATSMPLTRAQAKAREAAKAILPNISSSRSRKRDMSEESDGPPLRRPRKRAKRTIIHSGTPSEESESQEPPPKPPTKRAKRPIVQSDSEEPESPPPPTTNPFSAFKRRVAANMKGKSKAKDSSKSDKNQCVVAEPAEELPSSDGSPSQSSYPGQHDPAHGAEDPQTSESSSIVHSARRRLRGRADN